MDNPWGSEDADHAPLPSFRRESPLQSPNESVDRSEWSVPSWQVEEEQEVHAKAKEASAWPQTHDEELDSPRDTSRTASPELNLAFPARDDSHGSFSPALVGEQNLEQSARREEDDADDFGEMHHEAKEASWDYDAAAGWGGSSDWPPPSIVHASVEEEASFPSPQLELPEPKLEPPKWTLDTPQLEDRVGLPKEDEDASLRASRVEEPEDAWAAQAKDVQAQRPALPPKIPAELLSIVQERCLQLFQSAFSIDASNAFLPASGMGLALAALLDSDGQLCVVSAHPPDQQVTACRSHLAELRSPEMPLTAPLFAGSAVEKLYRAAVEATASRSAEIIKGSASRRGGRNAFGGSRGDIWSIAPAEKKAESGYSAFGGASALATPMLPSERMDLESLGSRTTSPPLDKGGLFGLFGRRSAAQTNMPSSLLQPKRAESPSSAPASGTVTSVDRSVSGVSRTSTDSASPAPRPLSPGAPSVQHNSGVDPAVPAGSAVSRFFGKVSGAMKARQGISEDSWFRRKADDDLTFPESRYEDSPDTAFKDEVGFSYDNDTVQVSTSPSTVRHFVPQDIDNLFDVFDRPTVDAMPRKGDPSDPFGLDPFASSPEVSRSVASANGVFADVMQPQKPALQPSISAANAVGKQPQIDPLASLSRPSSQPPVQALPATAQAPFSNFSLAPPPSSLQPLNRSQGPSLLDLDEGGPAPAVAKRDALAFMAPSVAKTRLAQVKAPPSGSGALSSSDLSFFEDL